MFPRALLLNGLGIVDFELTRGIILLSVRCHWRSFCSCLYPDKNSFGLDGSEGYIHMRIDAIAAIGNCRNIHAVSVIEIVLVIIAWWEMEHLEWQSMLLLIAPS